MRHEKNMNTTSNHHPISIISMHCLIIAQSHTQASDNLKKWVNPYFCFEFI